MFDRHHPLVVVITAIIVTVVMSWLTRGDRPREAPFELREAAANCILTNDPKSCAIYEKAKPDWPIRH